MLQTFTLLLPAMVPSWRFFDVIALSPRIEFRLLQTAEDSSCEWQEFRPRPQRLSLASMFARLFWNPRWNESLFLVSCAERFTMDCTEHSLQEMLTRIRAELSRQRADITANPWLQFRLAFLSREGTQVHKHITYVSPVFGSAGS